MDIEIFHAKTHLPKHNSKQQKRGKSGRKPRHSGRKGGSKDLIGGFKEAATSLTRISEGYMPLFPVRTRKMLRYHTTVTVTVTSGAVGTHVFRANDLFDPDATGTGHQPMGFDQMMVFYNHFAVSNCRIIVNITNTASTFMHAGIRLDASATPLTSADQILEFGGITYDAFEAKSTYGASKTLKSTVDIAKIQGIPRQNITTDPNLRGDGGTSPVELTYWHLLAWDPSGTSGAVSFDVTLEFLSYFMEPRDASISLAHMNLAEPSRIEETKQAGGRVIESVGVGKSNAVPNRQQSTWFKL